MICFEVSVNGERLCIAGVGEYGVLSAMTTWSRRQQPLAEAGSEDRDEDLELDVGGFYRDPPEGDGEHLQWARRPLSRGDVVSIRVLDSDSADEPAGRTPYVAEVESDREHEYYLRLKEKYEPKSQP